MAQKHETTAPPPKGAEHAHQPAEQPLAKALAEQADGVTPAAPTVNPLANPPTQETTGATRFKNGVIITMRGAGSLGHDPYTVGAGGDVGLRIQIPVSQTANALQVEQPDGTVVWSIGPSGVPGGATVTLTSAQILTLNTAPVPLIPAPAANQAIYVQGMTLQFKYSAPQYTGGGAVQPVYHGATVDLLSGSVPAATIQAAANSTTSLGSPAAVALTPGVGVDLYAATGNFAAGAGTAIVTIVYSIVTLG